MTDTKFNGTDAASAPPTRSRFQVGANDGETISSPPPSWRHRRRHGGMSTLTRPGARPTDVGRRRSRGDAGDLSTSTAIKNVSTVRAQLRRGAEPPRAPSEQPGHLPGEPDGVRVAHPRRGHGVGDDEVHEAEHPAAGRHEHARAGQPGARRASCRCSAKRIRATGRTPRSGLCSSAQDRPFGADLRREATWSRLGKPIHPINKER